MAIEIPKLNIVKFGNKIISSAKKHIFMIWMVFGFLLIICASYVYYYQIYVPSTAPLSPTIQLPVAEKIQLDQILKDLATREKRQQESSVKKISSPFEPIQ